MCPSPPPEASRFGWQLFCRPPPVILNLVGNSRPNSAQLLCFSTECMLMGSMICIMHSFIRPFDDGSCFVTYQASGRTIRAHGKLKSTFTPYYYVCASIINSQLSFYICLALFIGQYETSIEKKNKKK